MEWIDLYIKVKNKLNQLNITYSQYDIYELISTLEMAIEDDSKYIYVSDGWQDIEIKVSDILEGR